MRFRTRSWLVVWFTVFVLLGVSLPAAADDVYAVTTADGITLKMLRYRPSPEAPFRENAQTVLLFHGILCNMNVYLEHTPEENEKNYAKIVLPSPLATWARIDPYIKADPLRYYSLAHYLWIKGYDVWLANFRGTGRGELKSDRGSTLHANDVWGVLDVDPCVKKVIAETGIAPFIAGHSTGGFACQAYLQGTYFDPAELEDGYKSGYIPHVKSDPNLAAERNRLVKGYIALVPGTTPWIPGKIDKNCMWKKFGRADYWDIEQLMTKRINPLTKKCNTVAWFVDWFFNDINADDLRPDTRGYWTPYLNFWNMGNCNPFVTDFFAKYGSGSVLVRGLGQWGDIGLYHRMREFWKNGAENKDVVKGPKPDPGNDGYYYYDEHMPLLSAPTLAILSYAGAFSAADDTIKLLMQAKTSDPFDMYYFIPNSAHVDILCGLNAPYLTFPYISDWLDKVSGRSSGPLIPSAVMPEMSAANETQVSSN
ncbi:MAG: hypothetical protein ABFD81_18815 [Syntrophaceae bacterium]